MSSLFGIKILYAPGDMLIERGLSPLLCVQCPSQVSKTTYLWCFLSYKREKFGPYPLLYKSIANARF